MEYQFISEILSGDSVKLYEWMKKQSGQMLRKMLQTTKVTSRITVTRLYSIAQFIPEVGYLDEQLFGQHKKALDSIIQYYIQAKCDINEVCDNLPTKRRTRAGFTPLLLAIEQHKTSIVEAFIKAGADVNKPDTCGYTPLHWAAYSSSNVKVVKALIEAGADITAHIDRRIPPVLHIAVDEGRIEVVDFLLGLGMDINTDHEYKVLSEERWSALKSRYDCGELNEDQVWKKISAIGRAVRMRKIDVLKVLLRNPKAKVTMDDLHFCILEGDSLVANLILPIMDKSVLAIDTITGKHALHCLNNRAYIATSEEDPTHETKQLFLTYKNAGWSINSMSDFPKEKWYLGSLLTRTVVLQNNYLVNFLLEIGADMYLATNHDTILYPHNYDGNDEQKRHFDKPWESSLKKPTALHAAVLYGNAEALVLMVRYGADLTRSFGHLSWNEVASVENQCPMSDQFSQLHLGLNSEVSHLEKFLTKGFDSNFCEEKFEWLTEYLAKQKRLDKRHLTFSLLAGNGFIISQILQFLPEDVSLTNYSIFEDEIPALQVLLNWVLGPVSKVNIVPDLQRLILNEKLTYITEQFLRRGYSINNFKFHPSFPLPVIFSAIKLCIDGVSRNLFDLLLRTRGVDWNIKFKQSEDRRNALEYTLNHQELLDTANYRPCEWKWPVNVTNKTGPKPCLSKIYLKTLQDLLDTGVRAKNIEKLLSFYNHPCLTEEFTLMTKFRWAGANFTTILADLDEVQLDHQLHLKCLEAIATFKKWLAKEKMDGPSLTHLSAITARELLNFQSITSEIASGLLPKGLKKLILDYTPQRYN